MVPGEPDAGFAVAEGRVVAFGVAFGRLVVVLLLVFVVVGDFVEVETKNYKCRLIEGPLVTQLVQDQLKMAELVPGDSLPCFRFCKISDHSAKRDYFHPG